MVNGGALQTLMQLAASVLLVAMTLLGGVNDVRAQLQPTLERWVCVRSQRKSPSTRRRLRSLSARFTRFSLA